MLKIRIEQRSLEIQKKPHEIGCSGAAAHVPEEQSPLPVHGVRSSEHRKQSAFVVQALPSSAQRLVATQGMSAWRAVAPVVISANGILRPLPEMLEAGRGGQSYDVPPNNSETASTVHADSFPGPPSHAN